MVSDTDMDGGRSPSGRATHERSQSSLSPPAVGVPNAGQWAVLRSYPVPEVRQIAKVTPMLVKLEGINWPRQKPRTDIIACLDEKEAALKLAQSLAGAAGHREKRIRKAQNDFAERKASAWAEYERTEARLVASAIEARSDETRSGSAEGESAVPKGDAPMTAASPITSEDHHE